MSRGQVQLLNRSFLGGFLSAQETAWLLGISTDELRIISQAKAIDALWEVLNPKERRRVLSKVTMLAPLGSPTKNAEKRWDPDIVHARGADVEWLDKAIRTIRLHLALVKKGGKSTPDLANEGQAEQPQDGTPTRHPAEVLP